jgi:hypothetical protein
MKELSIEEKAKHYDEALERARKCWGEYNELVGAYENKGVCEEIFPELKESEDERISKHLLYHFRNKTKKEWNGMPVKDIIAWIEEQGEHKKFRDSIQVGDKVTKNEDGVLVNLSQLNRVAKKDEQILANSAKTCKDEQKPASFEISLLEKFKQAVYDCAWGKVTCKSEGETQDEYVERWTEQLLSIVRDWADDYIDYTIQQKLRKSYDKGKEDAIKENSSAWSEEDEAMRQTVMNRLELSKNGNVSDIPYIDRCISWLKSIRPQPKQEWSEEDEKGLADALWCCGRAVDTARDENEMGNCSYAENWLKSLRPQSHWKPTEEQLKALIHLFDGHLVGTKLIPKDYNNLKLLLEQLKAL